MENRRRDENGASGHRFPSVKEKEEQGRSASATIRAEAARLHRMLSAEQGMGPQQGRVGKS